MTVSAAGPVTVKLAPSSTGKVSADAVRALPVTNATTSANNVFTDHLYAPRVITRASDNQMVWRWDNADPFGVGQPDTNPAGLTTTFTYNPRFPGQLYDNETGLHYNYHRSYSPAIGAYTQPDPIGLNGGQLSLYGYVGGNPVNKADPLGLVNWSGTFGGVAGVDGVGAGFFNYSLTSECICGKKVTIKGVVSSLAAGAGVKYTGSGSSASFHDYMKCPDPYIANGGFAMISFASVFGGGGGYSKVTLGHLFQDFGLSGPVYGYDISTGLYLGTSMVTDVKIEDCCEK